MNTISTLQSKLKEVCAQVAAAERDLKESSSSFAQRLALDSLRLYESQLREQLQAALSDRAVEVVEFRLRGKAAQDGRLPLDVLSEFTLNLHRSLYAAAAFRKSGQVLNKGVPPQLEQQLNVEFVGIRPGSTRLYVSARTAPDLFGNSLTADTLRAAFDLLRADSEADAVEAVTQVGPAGARRFRELLRGLLRRDLQVDVTWSSPEDEQYAWRGTQQSLKRVMAVLGSVKTKTTEDVEVEAVVDGMNQRGKLELRRLNERDEPTGRLFRVTYSFDDLGRIRQLHLGDTVKATLRRTRVINPVNKNQQVAYFLRSLERSTAS